MGDDFDLNKYLNEKIEEIKAARRKRSFFGKMRDFIFRLKSGHWLPQCDGLYMPFKDMSDEECKTSMFVSMHANKSIRYCQRTKYHFGKCRDYEGRTFTKADTLEALQYLRDRILTLEQELAELKANSVRVVHCPSCGMAPLHITLMNYGADKYVCVRHGEYDQNGTLTEGEDE